jgi:hypothetical protein
LSTNTPAPRPAGWRLTSQSGGFTMARMRSCPGRWTVASSTRRDLAQGAAGRLLAIGSSMRMNHCGVLRKITGAWSQECG